MDSNILSNGPDPGEIPENMDQRIYEYPRRGSEYLLQIPPDNVNNHIVHTIP